MRLSLSPQLAAKATDFAEAFLFRFVVFQKIPLSYECLGRGEVMGTINDTVQIVEQAACKQITLSLCAEGSISDAPVDYIKVYEVRMVAGPCLSRC